MVAVVKQLLRKVLGKALLNHEELETVLCDVEATVNQRPLSYVSEDPEGFTPLTPFLFLSGQNKAEIPEADVVDGKSLKKRLQYVQRLREDLRSRFQKEYLGQLCQLRDKKSSRPLQIGEKVLVGRDGAKRVDWPIGTVEELMEGRDGKIRVARIRTQDGVMTRPVQRIFLMEYREEEADVKAQENKEKVTKTKSGRVVKFPVKLTYVIIN